MKNKFNCFSIILIFFLTSCSLREDPRAMATNQIFLKYDGERCQPYESFVPFGEQIQITIDNETNFEVTWYLVYSSIEGNFEDQESENILAQANAPSNQSTTSEFKAPYLPGRYDSFCVRDDDSSKRALTYLSVVQPYKDN